MSNNIQRAVAIGSDFTIAYRYGSNTKEAIEVFLTTPQIELTWQEREDIGKALEIITRITYSNSIHRAIEYAEKELK